MDTHLTVDQFLSFLASVSWLSHEDWTGNHVSPAQSGSGPWMRVAGHTRGQGGTWLPSTCRLEQSSQPHVHGGGHTRSWTMCAWDATSLHAKCTSGSQPGQYHWTSAATGLRPHNLWNHCITLLQPVGSETWGHESCGTAPLLLSLSPDTTGQCLLGDWLGSF